MKKILIMCIYILIINIIFADIPIIKAEIGYSVDFSEESQKVFNIIHKYSFEDKKNLTPEEKRLLNDKTFINKYMENTKN